jgi:hypothetical protein
MRTYPNWKGFLRTTPYPVRERALEKWAVDNLSLEGKEGGVICRFTLRGSTCGSGGTPFTMVLEAVFLPERGRLVISEGELRVPESDSQVLGDMCVSAGGRGGNLVFTLPPVLAGKPLERGIASLKNTNPAGCVCTEANRNAKWLWFLSTVHYALSTLPSQGPDRTV